MSKCSLTALAALAGSLLAPIIGHAQQFKVEKYDIRGGGGTDYIAVEAATGHVFISRGTHMMVVDESGKVLGDIPDTTGVHGAGIATKSGHGFATDGGDSAVTIFDLKTFAVVKKIPVKEGGLDGIMHDEPDVTHNACLFQPERGPAPAPAPGATPSAAGGRGRGPQGPIAASWFIVMKQ